MFKNIHSFKGFCRLCGSNQIKKSINLLPIPLGEKYSFIIEKNANRFPIDIYECDECKCVQTQDNIKNELLWGDYTYFSGQTPKIISHFKEFCKNFNKKYLFPKNSKIIDIGSNDGTLLKQFKNSGWNVIGIDPAETVVNEAVKNNIPTILGLFNIETIKQLDAEFKEIDLITAFNVFAHSDEMDKMMMSVKELLKADGIFCFEVQYLGSIMKKKLLGTIFHEHMIHYSAFTADYFLNLYGFELKDIEFNNIQHGSVIFYSGKKNNNHIRSEYVDHVIENEKKYGLFNGKTTSEFNNWLNIQKNKIQSIKEQWITENFEIAGYGAARSGPTLAIQLGLENTLKYLIDDHDMKVNKYSAFENLFVYHPEILLKSKPHVIVILAWIHYKNIIKQNIDYLMQGGKFLILWPEVKEITINNYDKLYENEN